MSATSTTENKTLPVPNRLPSTESSSQSILWYRATIGLVGLTFILILAYLAFALGWRSRPFMGMFTTHSLVVNAGLPASGETWAGLDAGIQQGDILRALDNIPLTDDVMDFQTAQQSLVQALSTYSVDDVVAVTVQRSSNFENTTIEQCGDIVNGVTQCTFDVQLQQIPDGDYFTFFGMPFITGIIIFSIGASIIYLRRNQSIAMMATALCMSTAIHTMGIFDLGTTWLLIPVWLTATAMIGGLLITLGLRFPTKLSIIQTQPVINYVPITVSLVITATSLFAFFNPELPQGATLSIQVASFFLIGSTVIFAAQIIGIQRPRALTLAKRDQTNTIIIGIALVIIPAALYILSRLVSVINPQAAIGISIEATLPFYITSSLSIAYAILQYRQFNTDRVISRSITYGIMLSVLVMGYFLFVTGLTFITQGAIQADNPILVALTMFGMVMMFSPLRNSLQERIDSIYYRTRYNYQQSVEQFSQKLTSLVNFDEIIGEFETVLEESVSPNNVFIFLPRYETGDYEAFSSGKAPTDIRFGSNSGVVKVLTDAESLVILEKEKPIPKDLLVDQSRISLLQPSVLAGLSGSGQLNGFVTIGQPRSALGAYAFEEIRFIKNLIAQLAIAIERAQVIDSLQREVKKLDVLSQVGQAVNFTIQFDDLLELINAQTSRLIEAPNFYIALHDTNANQIYYAFFLENDDRIEEKENVRWTSMDDLIHEVYNTSRSVNISDYAEEMRKRSAPITLESDRLKAWMAVPLVSGTRKLGVLAIGKTTLGEVYTNEQFKTLDDIGALAASSLDRLRLFNETNMRARQLQALNDISQKLSASELDVNGLLKVIMSSAVEILNTEAGSLLLVAEENPDEIEFKVVVGGSGEELIGSRLKKGQGVVGQVAETGIPVIENDVAHNTQQTDVSSDFATQSLLAVPLIAKENVIGVLEVINKTDKTLFVQDDIDLLTTFAGQAAIAIENARLFEMTDLQLAQQVRELEILETIDSKLNRTLELSEVARITVEAAMENVGAEGGALGIIQGSPPYLQIVALKGYEEEDYPTGADGLRWSLDRGVLSRVIRSRQADIVYDTKIDPVYESSLRNSISQITIPMLSADEINAILILETTQDPPFNLSQWAFTQRLAEHASIAIANAQLYAELTRANESKSEFMGFAAHELKTPLTSIKGFSDVMLSGMTGEIGEQQTNFLGTIRSNANRMQTIIDDLRDFAKLEAGQLNVDLSPVDIMSVINESIRPLQNQFDEKKQKVSIEKPDTLPFILADSIRLIQVLTNMLTNAHKYSDSETTITIGMEIMETYSNKQGQTFSNVMRISVKDEGLGMSEEDLKLLFHEKYFRSTNQKALDQPGTGLGMMITASIIQLHGGTIWVESELGVGSTFNLAIPLAPEQPEPEPVEQLPTTEPASD
jgi:signal transduction histidine kinase